MSVCGSKRLSVLCLGSPEAHCVSMVVCEQSARRVCESAVCTLSLTCALPHCWYTAPPTLGHLLHTLESSHATTGIFQVLMDV